MLILTTISYIRYIKWTSFVLMPESLRNVRFCEKCLQIYFYNSNCVSCLFLIIFEEYQQWCLPYISLSLCNKACWQKIFFRLSKEVDLQWNHNQVYSCELLLIKFHLRLLSHNSKCRIILTRNRYMPRFFNTRLFWKKNIVYFWDNENLECQ